MTKGRAVLPAGVFGLGLAVLLLRWLVPRPIGAADNGDGWRLLCPLGASEPDRISEDWVRMAYGPVPECASSYVSSQAWLLAAARWVGHRLGLEDSVNLYVVGVLACVLVAAAITLVVSALPLARTGRLIAAALLLLVLADSAIFGWFVSVLSEGAAFLGITLTVGGLLLLQRDDRWRYAGAGITTVGAVVAVNAKAQTLLLLPALVVALVLARKAGATVLARWALPVAVLLAVTAGTVLVQRSGAPAGGEYGQINAYHAIFDRIVRADHAEEDLAELGLPASFARYRGTGWWGEQPAHADPLWPEYEHLISRRTVAEYYAEHPVRVLEILHVGGKELLEARPDNIGSFVEGAGQPAQAQEFRVAVLSGISAALAPLGLVALVPVWLLTAVAAVRSWRPARPVAVVTVFVLVGGLGQFAAAALGEGSGEGVKHQVIALFCTFLGAVLGAVGLMARRHARARTGGAPAGPADQLQVPA